jgi:signal transduction histidine kinase
VKDVRPEEVRTAQFSTRDMAAFNHWLCITRLRAAFAVALFFPLLSYFGIARVDPVVVLTLCAALTLLSVVGLSAQQRIETSLTFFCVQTLADLTAITVGIGVATQGEVALLARPMFIMVIVPSSLISVRIGLGVAALATLGHGLLLGLERGFTLSMLESFEFLAPPFFFFLIAQQSLFYGGHLEKKNLHLTALADRLKESQRRLSDEGRLSAELVETARMLSATLDAPDPLPGFVQTIRERLWADWVAIFELDGAAGFRLRGVTEPDVAGSELDRLVFPLVSWPALEGLKNRPALMASEEEVRAMPAPFTGGKPLATVLIAALRREGSMVGFVAVGYVRQLASSSEWAVELLAGIAEHATIVLQSARLLEEVRAASALKSEFVGAVSHELRSPLNVILGYLEMLLDRELGPLTGEQVDALSRTRRQSEALLEMIEALLDLNRFEAGRLPVERDSVALDALLVQVRDQIPKAWQRPGVTLELDIEASLPPIETDPRKLKTVIRNLAHNALKFTEQGKVTLGAGRTASGEVAITVTDSGRGIPPEALSYVFDMFRQVPGSEGGGVGLGLHIVRRFVAALGGTVTVTSEVGAGTRFTVTLPLKLSGSNDARRAGEARAA